MEFLETKLIVKFGTQFSLGLSVGFWVENYAVTGVVIVAWPIFIFWGTGAVPAMKSEATAIFAPQDGRWKITVSFDGRRFCVPKFRH